MQFTLTAKQRELLSEAAQRKDRLLAIPLRLKGAAAQKVAAKLVAAGLVKEVTAKAGATIWRRDAENEQGYALKLTATGLVTVAPETQKKTETAEAQDTSTAVNDRRSRRMSRSRPDRVPNSEIDRGEGGTDRDFSHPANASPRSPRRGSKLDRILGMLAADMGATLDELTRVTGWLPHTARAALTGLRKRGYDVRLSRGDKEGASVYRVSAPTRASAR
jgi:Protein of unknown function (DUF3489)